MKSGFIAKCTAAAAALLLFVQVFSGMAAAGTAAGTAGGQKGQEICELVIETVTAGADNPDIPLVEEAVNKITEPAIGVRIRLMNVSIQQHAAKIGQMITSGDQLDLVTAGLTYPMVSMAADGLLRPLNDLVENYGQDLTALFGDTMKAGYVGDVLYAIPSKCESAMAGGLMYNGAMAEQLGVTIPDSCTMDDLDEVFAVLKEKMPDVYGTAFITREVSIMNFLYSLESYGSGQYAFGVTYEPWNNTDIVNLYESDQYRSFCLKMQQWQEKGYLPSNLMTSSILPTQRMAEGQIFCQFTGYSPMFNPGELVDENSCMVQTTPAMIHTGLVQERMWAVPVSGKYPEKAIEFLNFLYTNPELANLLTNGIENMHYTRVSDSLIAHTENQNYHSVFTVFGNQLEVPQWLPATEDTMEQQKLFEQEAEISLTMGYVFDSTAVEWEAEAVTDVIRTYAPALECGMVKDVDEALKEFNQELKKAGIDRVIEENRRQLSKWLKEQTP